MSTVNEDQAYVYTVKLASIASQSSGEGSVNIASDVPFEAQKITAFADIAGAVQTEDTRVLPLVRFQIVDTGSSRNFFSEQIPIPSFCGDGRIPGILPVIQVFEPNSTIVLQFFNYSAATDYANLYINFIGVKKFSEARGVRGRRR